MRKLLTVVLLAAALLAVATSFAQQGSPEAAAKKSKKAPPKAKKLTRAEIDEWLAKPGEVLFIDVRRPDEVSSNGVSEPNRKFLFSAK